MSKNIIEASFVASGMQKKVEVFLFLPNTDLQKECYIQLNLGSFWRPLRAVH